MDHKNFDFSPFPAVKHGYTPDDQECFQLWDKYEMMPHIREHSLLVARIATFIAGSAQKLGLLDELQPIRSAALLHDLGKTYTIRNGGNHSQIGASWVISHTGNPLIAQGVIHHVYWPGNVDIKKHFLPLTIIYADKRVKHDKIVSLMERREDLLQRYGLNKNIIQRIYRSFSQTQEIEHQLCSLLEVDLHAHSFDRRGMVQ